MDKFYNDRLKVFSSNKYIKIKKTNNKLSVYVPKLKSYKGMFKVFFIYFVNFTCSYLPNTQVCKTNSSLKNKCVQIR